MTGILLAIAGNSYAALPVNTSVPVISGSAVTGSTLTSSTGTWTGTSPISYTYQWQRGTTNITGATSSSYTVQVADEGSTLRCVVTATNVAGSASANSANTAIVVGPSAPVNTAVPVISGTATVGATLSSSTGTWTGFPTPTYTYQWQRGTTNISGATSSSYTVQSADAGSTLRCVVTATNTEGSASANSANTAAVTQAPANTVAPTVVGRVEKDFTLGISLGTWVGYPTPTYTYQWQRGASNISGATGSTYTLTASDVGSTIRCRVTGTNTVGSATVTTASTAAVYQPPMAYGTSYQGGYFAGQISTAGNGVANFNLVVAPKSSGDTTAQYKTTTTVTSGTTSLIDGAANTAAMIAAGAAAHPAGNFCNNLTIGGYTDWYMPARYELELIYWNFKPDTSSNVTSGSNAYAVPQHGNYINSPVQTPARTSVTDFRTGGANAMNTADFYWSSSGLSGGGAYRQLFTTGSSGSATVTTSQYVRAVRKVAA